MKIVLLAGTASIHTIRWANGLSAAGVEVHVISQHPVLEPMDDAVNVHLFPVRGSLGYFTMVPGVKKLLQKIQPDLVNAHYASGYATTAKLAAYRPWLLSVWGADVYDFPRKSAIHRFWVRSNLLAADAIASTSHCMAEETKGLVPERTDIAITPFGVDIKSYAEGAPSLRDRSPDSSLVIGTVKVMSPKYGIDTLIRAFALLRRRLSDEGSLLAEKLILRLVGDGPQVPELRSLVAELDISECTTFVGRVPHKTVPAELGILDIYVALSALDSESFGVAIIEAGAAGRPVVVSDAGGLPEVVIDGTTGLVVPRGDPQAAAEALYKLAHDPELRIKMGEAGQRHVSSAYSWSACVEEMKLVYRKTISEYKSGCGVRVN